MKRLIMTAMLILSSISMFAEPVVVRNGNRFRVESSKSISTSTDNIESCFTGYEYEVDGQVYPIYMNSNGAYFIIKVSKRTQRIIRYYLPWVVKEQLDEEIDAQNFLNSKLCKR